MNKFFSTLLGVLVQTGISELNRKAARKGLPSVSIEIPVADRKSAGEGSAPGAQPSDFKH